MTDEASYNPFEENRKALRKEGIVFIGGPAAGQRTEVPRGVNSLHVQTAFGSVHYVRDETNETHFILGDGIEREAGGKLPRGIFNFNG